MKQGPHLRLFAASAIAVALLLGCSGFPATPELAPAASSAAVVRVEVLNPDVHQANIQDTICVPGYTATVRPSTTYKNGVKTKLIRELGLPPADAAKYELDHRIQLALGGHPWNPHNLALQRWDGEAGAKKKGFFRTICGRFETILCLRDALPTASVGRFVASADRPPPWTTLHWRR